MTPAPSAEEQRSGMDGSRPSWGRREEVRAEARQRVNTNDT